MRAPQSSRFPLLRRACEASQWPVGRPGWPTGKRSDWLHHNEKYIPEDPKGRIHFPHPTLHWLVHLKQQLVSLGSKSFSMRASIRFVLGSAHTSANLLLVPSGTYSYSHFTKNYGPPLLPSGSSLYSHQWWLRKSKGLMKIWTRLTRGFPRTQSCGQWRLHVSKVNRPFSNYLSWEMQTVFILIPPIKILL